MGASLQQYSYEPFGAPLQSPAPAASAPQNRFGFAGEYTDPTGDVYLRARQYDPTTGRFAGTDPVTPGVATPWTSLYAYVGNQPGVLVDPSGMVSCPSLPVGASQGQVASWRSCLHTESDQEASVAAGDTFVNRLAASRDETFGAIASTATAPVRAIAHPKRTANGFKNYVQEGWSRDGLRGVVNNFNPIYLGLTHGEQARQALANGDPAAAAREIFSLTMDAEALIGCAAGGASAVAGKTTLYRAVGPEELTDIRDWGRYRAKQGGVGGKCFFDTAEQASNFSRMMGDQPYTVTSTRVSPSKLRNGDRIEPAGEGPGYFFGTSHIPTGRVTVFNHTPLP